MRSPGAAVDLRAALSEEIRGALHELNSAMEQPKAMHRCRLHLKRARALARVGRAVAPGLAAVFNESARSVMHTLAQARDLAALAEVARRVGKKSARKERSALGAVASTLDAHRAALPPLDLEQVRGGLRDLQALAQVWPEASERQIERGAARVVRRARQASRRGSGREAPPRRHEWRKREKDRLYVASLLGHAWPARRKRRRKCGEKLADALGRERDALLLIDRLAADPSVAGSPKAAARALSALRRERDRIARKADEIGARLHRGGA